MKKLIITGALLASSIFLGMPEPAKAYSVNPGSYQARVCTQSTALNVRNGASIYSKVIGSVSKDQFLTVVAETYYYQTEDIWYKINIPGTEKFGWVSGDYICFY